MSFFFILFIINVCDDLDPLENEDALIESLNYLGQIAHKKYRDSGMVITQLFDPITIQYQELVNSISVANPEGFREMLEIIETKFAWLIYIMAAFVGNRAVNIYIFLRGDVEFKTLFMSIGIHDVG